LFISALLREERRTHVLAPTFTAEVADSLERLALVRRPVAAVGHGPTYCEPRYVGMGAHARQGKL